MSLPLIILGGGGHARVLADILLAQHRTILGFTDPDPAAELLPNITHLGNDDAVLKHTKEDVLLVNGQGSVTSTRQRREIYLHLVSQGYAFAEITHSSGQRARQQVHCGSGYQQMAASVVGPAVIIGDNVLINTHAVVEHDCKVGNHCHIASGAILCGGCQLGEDVHVGAGAVIIQGISIGSGAIIAAGAVVTKNVEPLTLVAGVPAKTKRALNEQ